LQCVAVCCIVLQCGAARYRMCCSLSCSDWHTIQVGSVFPQFKYCSVL